MVKKKLFAAALSLSLLLGSAAALPQDIFTKSTGITAAAVNTATSGECGADVTWTLEDGVLTLSGVGKTYVDDNSFKNRNDIKKVIIKSGITSIGNKLFYYCQNLESVSIPNTVTVIGEYAFYYNRSLQSITIPNSVTSIGQRAFYNCDAATSLTISNKIKEIPLLTFFNCKSFKSVTIPNSVKSIGEGAFWCCEHLTYLTLPTSVTTIEGHAFASCPNLATVKIPDTVKEIGSYSFGYYWYSPGSTPIKIDDFTIYCHKGSAAAEYAKKFERSYILVDNPKITSQPGNQRVSKTGNTATYTVAATGSDLKYEWYYKDVGMKSWGKSSNTKRTYSFKVTKERNGRQVFCKVIDVYGAYVKTRIATAHIAGTVLVINQPTNVKVAESGSKAKFSVKALGANLTYEWYVKDPKGSWTKTAANSSTYNVSVTAARNGRQVFCKVTDSNGRSARSDIAVTYITGTVVIYTQPKNYTVSKTGNTAYFSVGAAGKNLKYEWYVKDPGKSWKKAGATTNKYSISVIKERNGRQVFCKVIEANGKYAKSNIVTAKIK